MAQLSNLTCIAIAVRDDADLFLLGSVCQSVAGDVYMNFVRNQDANWRPHMSYHASGQHHSKSYNHKLIVGLRQKPDFHFIGTENLVTFGVAAGEARAINEPYDAKRFASVFEIAESDLRAEQYTTHLSIDLSDINGEYIITPGSTVLKKFVYGDAIPRILITLFIAERI